MGFNSICVDSAEFVDAFLKSFGDRQVMRLDDVAAVCLGRRLSTEQQVVDLVIHKRRVTQRFEPLTFRYSFLSAVILFRVDFASEAEAVAFATAFDGKIVAY
jgi:hypothetical protein